MSLVTNKSSPNKCGSCLYLLIASLLILWICITGCRPTPHEPPISPELATALERFEKAEQLFQEHAYPEALTIYQNHLRQFPGGPLADTALMKIGTLHLATGDYREARKVFHRLIREHPKSILVEDARLHVILAYHKEGNDRAAINYASSVLRIARTRHYKSRIYNLMGDSYSSNGQFKDSIESYMDAYQLAEPQAREEIISKVKEVITFLQEPELNALLELYADEIPGGYLRLQLAKNYARKDRMDLAMDVLSDFISVFPYHDELETATALMEELKSRSLIDPFSIGCILPLSGPYAVFGNRALMGIELALDQFNAQPGVNPILLLIKDSQGNPSQAARAVEDLALKDRVIGIIGPMITSESAAIRAQDLKVPIVTLTQKPDITKLGDYVFRNFLTPSLQIKAIVTYAVQELGIGEFAILYPREPYGVSFMNRFWDELIVHGARIIGIESYGADQTDFADPINKLVGMYYPRPEEPEQSKRLHDPSAQLNEATPLADQSSEGKKNEPEPIVDFAAVFIPDTFEKVGMIAPQFPYYDVSNVLLLGTNLWHSEKLIQMARRYVQGAIVPDGFFLKSPSPMVQDFVRSFEEIFGTQPGFLEAQAYDAALILFQLTNQPSVQSRLTLKIGLLEVKDFPGMTGLTSFDETGDVDKQIYLLKIRGDQFVQIRP